MAQTFKYFIILFGFLLASCGGSNSSSSPPVSTPPTPPVVVQPDPVIATISTSKSDGLEGTAFTATANVTPASSGLTYQWETSDGQVFSTETINVTFPGAGFFNVSLKVEASDGGEADANLDFVVFEADDPTPDILNMADRFTDMTNDGVTNLSDFLRLSQFRNGLVVIDDRRERAIADIDLDNDVDGDDSRLLAKAVFESSELPTDVFGKLAKEIRPLSLVTVVSPVLLNPESVFSVSIQGEDAAIVSRTVLGYLDIVVPRDAVASENAVITVSDETGVVLEIGFALLEPMATTQNPENDLLTIADEIAARRNEASQALISEFGAGGLSDLFISTSEASEKGLRDLYAELAKPENDQLAQFIVEFLNSNGDEISLIGLAPLGQKVSGAIVCELVDGVCNIKNITGTYSRFDRYASKVCIAATLAGAGVAVAGTAGIGTPAAVAGAIASIAAICIPLEGVGMVNEALSGIVEPFDFRFDLKAEQTGQGIYNLDPRVILVDSEGICGALGTGLNDSVSDYMADLVGDVLEGRIKRKIPGFRTLTGQLRRISESTFQEIEDVIEDLAGDLIETTGLVEPVAGSFDNICTNVFPAGGGSENAATADVLEVLSFDQTLGSISVASDFTADFTCSPDIADLEPSGLVDITAQKELCSGTTTIQETVTCFGTTNVGIEFGDNGNLNDDIYEVSLEGQSFSSNTPQRSVRGNVELAQGQEFVVTMRGLAAPDGVGTYFIRFTGATVVSGDALSGTDLTPGVIKTYTIRVDQGAS